MRWLHSDSQVRIRTGDAAPMAYIGVVGRHIATEDLEEDYANAQAVPAQEVAQETAPDHRDGRGKRSRG